MKNLIKIIIVFISISCSTDTYPIIDEEITFIENPEKILVIDIIYVLPSGNYDKSIYNIDESNYVKNLNSHYFHKYNIGFVLGESRTIISDELYDLKDNRGNESKVFMQETNESFKSDRLNIYIIKRSNIIAIAGMATLQRALITNEFLNKTTSPHEIGHALGLGHQETEGNIMSIVNPHLRKKFTNDQVNKLKRRITSINN